MDARFAIRSLTRDRWVSLISIAALALGIGSSTVIFSVFYNLLLNPFPYKAADRLISFEIRTTTSNGATVGRNFYSIPEFRAFREQNSVFEDIVGYHRSSSVLYNDSIGTRALPGMAIVTANTFQFYGLPSLLGRTLLPEDGNPGAPPVFVMNYKLWRTEFNADRDLLGRSFLLDGEPRTLVGIMPPRFDVYDVSIWIPKLETEGGTLQIVGRLKHGISPEKAAADLDVIAHRLTKREAGFALNPERYAVVAERVIDSALGNFKKALYALLAAVLLLLMIACVNVASLLLARATGREKEIALRSALGASRSRVFRELLLENFILSAAACSLGCVLARFILKLLVGTVLQRIVPGEVVIELSSGVLIFAIGITLVTTLLCSIAPGMFFIRRDLQLVLTSSGKGISGFAYLKARGALVIVEVALSMVLLVGASLVMRNFFALTHINLPFNPSATMYAQLVLPRDRYYSTPDAKPAFFQQLLPRIKAVPGVVSVTESLMLPPNEESWTDVVIPGKPHSERWVTSLELCTEGYFQTLGLRLILGRLLSQHDIDGRRYVVVVNEALVHKYFGTDDPIGQKIKFEVLDRPFVDGPHNTYFEIIGVVSDFKSRPERTGYKLNPEAFLPASVAGFGYPLYIIAKTRLDPHSLINSVSREVWALDPDIALAHSGSIEDRLKEDFVLPQLEFVTLSAFAVVGILLIVVGSFSLMTYSVMSRIHDIGVRMALGAGRGDILRMVLKEGMALTIAGTLIGLLASVAVMHFLTSILWSVSAADPWAFGGATAVIMVVGAVACLIPAYRAAQQDPLVTLHYE